MKPTPNDKTADFAWLESELLAFIDERALNGVMPSLESLRSARRQDLLDGLARHGGRKAVAERLGLGLAIPRKPYGTWQQPGEIDRELLAFIAEHGAEGKMPSRAELAAAGRVDLALAISRGEGVTALSKRLGLKDCQTRLWLLGGPGDPGTRGTLGRCRSGSSRGHAERVGTATLRSSRSQIWDRPKRWLC